MQSKHLIIVGWLQQHQIHKRVLDIKGWRGTKGHSSARGTQRQGWAEVQRKQEKRRGHKKTWPEHVTMHREPDHHRTVDCGEGLHVSLRQFCIWKLGRGPIPQRGEIGQGRTTGEQIHTVCLGWSRRLLCGLRVKAYSTPTHYATRKEPVHFRRRGADKSLVSLKRTNAELCKGSFKFAKYTPQLIFKI